MKNFISLKMVVFVLTFGLSFDVAVHAMQTRSQKKAQEVVQEAALCSICQSANLRVSKIVFRCHHSVCVTCCHTNAAVGTKPLCCPECRVEYEPELKKLLRNASANNRASSGVRDLGGGLVAEPITVEYLMGVRQGDEFCKQFMAGTTIVCMIGMFVLINKCLWCQQQV